jgi:hypothetical protein
MKIKKAQRIWELRSYGIEKMTLTFSSKKEVFRSIELWADNAANPYVLREDIRKMDRVNGSEIIHLDYRNGNTEMLFIHRTTFNNGSDLTLLGRD